MAEVAGAEAGREGLRGIGGGGDGRNGEGQLSMQRGS